MEIKQGGVVSQLLAGVPIPRMFRARQIFPQEHIEPADIPAAVTEQLDREPFRSKVQPGMEIRVTTYYGEYVYEVTETAVHEATDDTSYDFSRTDENLILYTCYPFDSLGYTPFRFFVYADYVSGPALTIAQQGGTS